MWTATLILGIFNKSEAMISQDYNSAYIANSLVRKIQIRENQLKIAQESHLIYVTEALKTQLLELQRQLSELQDLEVEALMSLLDDC